MITAIVILSIIVVVLGIHNAGLVLINKKLTYEASKSEEHRLELEYEISILKQTNLALTKNKRSNKKTN